MKGCLREGAIQEFWSKVGELSWQCEWPLNFVSGEVMKSICILWDTYSLPHFLQKIEVSFESSFGNTSFNLSKGWFNSVKVIVGI